MLPKLCRSAIRARGAPLASPALRQGLAAGLQGARRIHALTLRIPALPKPQAARNFHASSSRALEIFYSEPEASIGKPAPTFEAPAVIDLETTTVDLEQYKGKWVVLLFYPKDFTFVCPTEIIAFSDRHAEFKALNAQVLAISTDTEECHLAWCRTSRKRGGLGHMQIPLVADTTKAISAGYGVLLQDKGIALRGLFIINPDGVLEQITVNNLGIGRSVSETLRLLQAYQYVAEHGEVCPADWKPGQRTMVADAEKSLEYFEAVASAEAEDDPLKAGARVKVIKSKHDYEEAIKAPLAVVDFVAPWCGKCRQIQPYVNELSEQFTNVTFAKFDTTEEAIADLASELGVKTLPAFHFFKNGHVAANLEAVTGYKKKLLREAVETLAANT